MVSIRNSLVAAALLAGAAGAQDLEIKGIKPGDSKEAAIAALPGLTCSNNACTLFPGSHIRLVCGQVLSYRNGGIVRDEAATACGRDLGEKLSFGPARAISSELTSAVSASGSNWITLYRVSLADGKVGSVSVDFGVRVFPDVTAALTAKFGPPTSEVNVPVQNKMGATFDSRVVTWTKSAGSIVATERSGTINDSTVTMVSNDYAVTMKRQSEERAKAAVKGL